MLALSLLTCPSVLSALALLLLTSLFLGHCLLSASSLISLLLVLVYLGSLIVLFAYMWMFIPFSCSRFGLVAFVFPLLLFVGSGPRLGSSSLLPLLYATSLLLFLVGLLF